MSELSPTPSLVPAFIASIIHKNLKSLASIKSVVELNSNIILTELNNLVKTYNNKFGYDSTGIITKDSFRTAIQDSPFHNFIAIQDDILKVQTTPDVYQSNMSDIIVSSTSSQSRIILNAASDFVRLYKGALQAEEHAKNAPKSVQADSSAPKDSEGPSTNQDNEQEKLEPSEVSNRITESSIPKEEDAEVRSELPQVTQTSRIENTDSSESLDKEAPKVGSDEELLLQEPPQSQEIDIDSKKDTEINSKPTLDSIRPTDEENNAQSERAADVKQTDTFIQSPKAQPVDEVKRSDKELEEPSPEVDIEPIDDTEKDTAVEISNDDNTSGLVDTEKSSHETKESVEPDNKIESVGLKDSTIEGEEEKSKELALPENTALETKEDTEDLKTDESDDESDDDIDSDSEDEDGHIRELKRSQRQRQAVKKKETSTTPVRKETTESSPSSNRKRSLSPSPANPQQRKRFQHIAVNLINSIQAHRYSSPFLHPVNKKEAMDYEDIIYQPKDLKNILKSLKSKQEPLEYQSIKELERDVMLMFANCIMYNRSDTDLVELTKSMKNDVKATFKIFEDAASDI